MSMFGKPKPVTRSYILLVDDTGRMTKDDIALFPGPISEIGEVTTDTGRNFRVAVEHPSGKLSWDALQVHRSPFQRDALILPIFQGGWRIPGDIGCPALCALDHRALSPKHLASCAGGRPRPYARDHRGLSRGCRTRVTGAILGYGHRSAGRCETFGLVLLGCAAFRSEDRQV
jgi:hypothetical protein